MKQPSVKILRYIERRVDRRRWQIYSIARKETANGPEIVSRPIKHGDWPIEFQDRDEARIYRMTLNERLRASGK